MARALVSAAGGVLRTEVDYGIPAVVSDGPVISVVEGAARHIVGALNIITGWRNPFADDVALFLTAAPDLLQSPPRRRTGEAG